MSHDQARLVSRINIIARQVELAHHDRRTYAWLRDVIRVPLAEATAIALRLGYIRNDSTTFPIYFSSDNGLGTHELLGMPGEGRVNFLISNAPDQVDLVVAEHAGELARVRDWADWVGGEKPAAEAGETNSDKTKAAAGRSTVVVWEGAEPTERNIRLARTRTAYMEAQGKVTVALEALEQDGFGVSRSTFYNHLNALDAELPGWRNGVLLSNPNGNLDGLTMPRKRGKPPEKMR